jgi:hypothetical protein
MDDRRVAEGNVGPLIRFTRKRLPLGGGRGERPTGGQSGRTSPEAVRPRGFALSVMTGSIKTQTRRAHPPVLDFWQFSGALPRFPPRVRLCLRPRPESRRLAQWGKERPHPTSVERGYPHGMRRAERSFPREHDTSSA